MRRSPLVNLLLLLALVGVLPCASQAGEERNKRALILERRGKVGDFTVGKPIKQYGAYVQEVESGVYRSHDRNFEFKVDPNGNISEITATEPGLFTDRFIRLQYSTLLDVLRSYGKYKRVRYKNHKIILQYEGIDFSFDGVRNPPWTKAEGEKVLQTRLSSVTVKKSSRPAAGESQPP